MSFQKYLTGAGLPGGSARELVGRVTLAITATGSTSQANSKLIEQPHNVVTAGAAATGVRLPGGLGAGDWGTIQNNNTETLFVYPPVGGAINGGSDNAKVDVTTLKGVLFVAHGNDDFTVLVGG